MGWGTHHVSRTRALLQIIATGLDKRGGVGSVRDKFQEAGSAS